METVHVRLKDEDYPHEAERTVQGRYWRKGWSESEGSKDKAEKKRRVSDWSEHMEACLECKMCCTKKKKKEKRK